MTPGDLDFIKTFSGGSEAIDAAIKLTRQYWKQSGHPGKYKVISRYYGYHGSTFGAMAASGTGPRKSKFEPQMGGFVKVFPPTHYRGRFATWEECNRFAAASVEDVIVAEDPETVAAVVVEPIGNTGGIITPTQEYFVLLREICDRHGVLLIFDEVITGFGKTGSMFAAQSFGVTPDIICCGKGMSSELIPSAPSPPAAVSAPRSGARSGTTSTSPTATPTPAAPSPPPRAAPSIVGEELCARARDHGAHLRARLEALRSTGVVREVRGCGVLLGVELTDPRVGTALGRRAIGDGLILRVDPGWFAIAPALTASRAQLDAICDQIEASLKEAIADA